MKRKWLLIITQLLLVAMVTPAWAAGGRKLNDRELDQVAAGDFNVQMLGQGMEISFDSGNQFKNHVFGEGTVMFQTEPLPSTCGALSCTVNTSTVSLGPNAQQGVQSLVNLIAVNSLVNILINMNVNVVSQGATQTIGSITQTNGVGKTK